MPARLPEDGVSVTFAATGLASNARRRNLRQRVPTYQPGLTHKNFACVNAAT
jgi:hypothetical protein